MKETLWKIHVGAAPERQLYARMFDIHFYDEDCPQRCEKYERYKAWRESYTGEEGGMNGGSADGGKTDES